MSLIQHLEEHNLQSHMHTHLCTVKYRITFVHHNNMVRVMHRSRHFSAPPIQNHHEGWKEGYEKTSVHKATMTIICANPRRTSATANPSQYSWCGTVWRGRGSRGRCGCPSACCSACSAVYEKGTNAQNILLTICIQTPQK